MVCSIRNYVGISCSTLKIIFKKLYNDSQFNKLKMFDKSILELIFSFLIPSDIKNIGTILFSVKQSDFFQQMEVHKATKVNLINVSMINKDFISAVLIYYLEMTKCLLNFLHLKKNS